MSVFIERSRIDRIEREDPESLAKLNSSKERGWSTGNVRIDGLIKLNAAKYGVDPYLIFCVMEQESHFNPRALSPKGARGLMQLMPGTAARFGVRKVHDPAQNIAGGTRYLKQLMTQFNGRVDLVLASYNAGEGAVMKYGNRVPPYRETRNYVKRIGYKYRRAKTPVPLASKNSVGGN
jgi:soluble lytic murein transglycosylase-like protein